MFKLFLYVSLLRKKEGDNVLDQEVDDDVLVLKDLEEENESGFLTNAFSSASQGQQQAPNMDTKSLMQKIQPNKG